MLALLRFTSSAYSSAWRTAKHGCAGNTFLSPLIRQNSTTSAQNTSETSSNALTSTISAAIEAAAGCITTATENYDDLVKLPHGHAGQSPAIMSMPAEARKEWKNVTDEYPTKLSFWAMARTSQPELVRRAVRQSDGRFVTYRPVAPGRRHRKDVDLDVLGVHQGEPVEQLVFHMHRDGGRDPVTGRIRIRGRGGGMKRMIRRIDFARIMEGPQRVVRVELDPLRSAFVALLRHDVSGALCYILAPQGLQMGDVVYSYRNGLTESDLQPQPGQPSALIQAGNCLRLQHIPLGTRIHCIALQPEGPGILCRAAGTFATLVARQGSEYSHVRLQSGEVRLIDSRCIASIGAVSNPDHMHQVLGKAGRRRNIGRRPKVRGVAMNPCDHPHGGGVGRTKGKHPQTPWGTPARGVRGRDPRKPTWWIIKDRRASAN